MMKPLKSGDLTGRRTGFIPVDAGSLEHAAMLENPAKLWITLAYKTKGPHFAFTLLHPRKS